MTTATRVRETLEEAHERILRQVFSKQFKIYIPKDLSHEQKAEIKGQMFMQNLKSVTAKLPATNSLSTMIFENPISNKAFAYGVLVIQNEDGTISHEEFTASEGDNLAERIGEEVFASAKKFKS